MDCRQMDAVFDRGARAARLPGAARDHLSQCSRCRAVYGFLAADSEAEVPPGLRDRIGRALSPSLCPVNRLPRPALTVLGLLAAYAALLALLLSLMGTAGGARMTAAQLVLMSVLLTGGAALFSLSLSWQMRPGSRQPLRALAIFMLPGSACVAAMAWWFSWPPPVAFVAQGWPCLAAGLAMAAATALVLGFLVRRGAPVSIPAMSATLGAAAGWLALAVLQFKCPHQQAQHLLVWHGGVLFVSAAAGLLFGRRLRNLCFSSREVV